VGHPIFLLNYSWMRNVLDESCREKQNTHFMFGNFFSENVRFGQTTDVNIKRCIRIACWITKATDTHSEYVILIAFPRQHWLGERASMLNYTYISCLIFCINYRYSEIGSQCTVGFRSPRSDYSLNRTAWVSIPGGS
jgi:hypothetical protein